MLYNEENIWFTDKPDLDAEYIEHPERFKKYTYTVTYIRLSGSATPFEHTIWLYVPDSNEEESLVKMNRLIEIWNSEDPERWTFTNLRRG